MKRLLRSLPIVLSLFAVPLLGIGAYSYAATLQATIAPSIVATYRGSNDLGSPSYNLSRALQPSIALESGTGSYQANALFADQRTLAASTTENLDLAGVLTDPLGSTLTFATVKAIQVCAADGNTNNVVVGGADSAQLAGVFSDTSDKVVVKPGGCFIWVAPKTGATVTATTADLLQVGNSSSGSAVTYNVVIIGTVN